MELNIFKNLARLASKNPNPEKGKWKYVKGNFAKSFQQHSKTREIREYNHGVLSRVKVSQEVCDAYDTL